MVKEPLTFYVSCSQNNSKQEIVVHPPADIIRLSKSCVASSGHFVILGYYENSSQQNVESTNNLLTSYKYDETLWGEFHKLRRRNKIQNFTIEIPEKLEPMPEIPMSLFLDELKAMQKIRNKSRKFPLWGYLLIAVGLFVVWVIVRFIVRRFCPGLTLRCSSARPNNRTRLHLNSAPVAQRRTGEAMSASGEKHASDVKQMSVLLQREADDEEAVLERESTPKFPSLMLSMKE